MFSFQGQRKLWLAAAAAGLMAVAGCSNEPQNQATNQPVPPPKKAAPAPANRPAVAKAQPSSAKAAPAKATAKPVSASSKVAPAPKLVMVPKGTILSAKVGTTLVSSKNKVGDTFAATLASSVKVDGKTVIPKGAKVTGHVVTDKRKTPELTVALTSVEVQGKSYPLQTNSIGPADQTQPKDKSADSAASQPKKDVTIAAQSRLKFKLMKPVKLPVKS
jgi:glucose/arabinose dehydrogenase